MPGTRFWYWGDEHCDEDKFLNVKPKHSNMIIELIETLGIKGTLMALRKVITRSNQKQNHTFKRTDLKYVADDMKSVGNLLLTSAQEPSVEVSTSQLLSVVVYCDYTKHTTKFKESFRQLRFTDMNHDIKTRHEDHY